MSSKITCIAAIALSMLAAGGARAAEACSEPGYAVYFGAGANPSVLDVAGASIVKVSMRNAESGWGFSLGIRKDGEALSFFDDPAAVPALDLLFTKENGTDTPLQKGNSAKGAAAGAVILAVLPGSAISSNSPGDFLAVGISADGRRASIGYISDATGSGKTIGAATVDPLTGGCAAQEILAVKLSTGEVAKFSRGDANGDRKVDIADGVAVAFNIFAGRLAFFDCKSMLDVNDDGQLNAADPVYLVKYLFLEGPRPLPPFGACGADPTTDLLTCAQPNC